MNVEKLDLIRMNLNKLKAGLERYLSHGDSADVYWGKGPLKEEIKALESADHHLKDKVKEFSELKPTKYPYMLAKDFKPLAETLLSMVVDELEELRKVEYKNLTVDYQYYKCKTLLYDVDDDNNTYTIRYFVGSFHSRQEINAMLANFQKGIKRVRLSGEHRNLETIRNGYNCIYERTLNENIGDGYHAVIWNDNDHVIRVHKKENIIDKVFQWIKSNVRTGLIDDWKTYFYNELSDLGLISVCKGIDLTDKAPSVIVLSEDIDTELIRTMKQTALKNGSIQLSVEENVPLNPSMSFLELIQDFVLQYIQNEAAHYNVGEPICNAIKTPIVLGPGKTTRLYPRQQIIAQGLLNAAIHGKKSLFLNGGMGIGKTFQGIKFSYALAEEFHKTKNFRVLVYAQGHLIPKWERQFVQCLNPQGIYPTFYQIDNFKDLKNISKKPNGFEVFLLPKDKVKRGYMSEYASRHKINPTNLHKIARYVDEITDNITDNTNIIIECAKNLSLNLLRLAATKLEKVAEKPVILMKETLNDKGEVESYKVVSPSRKIKSLYGTTIKNYDFILEVSEIDKFYSEINAIKGELIKETELKDKRVKSIQNGLTCSVCGGLQYFNEKYLLDEEMHLKNIYDKPSDRSESNSKCKHYIKVDGTPLMKFEIEGIRNGRIGVVYAEKFDKYPYVTEEGSPLEPQDLIKAKAGKFTGIYNIVVRVCNEPMWSAFDKKGYRIVNATEVMLKKFGKKGFHLGIHDECHIYAKESNQGNSFGTLCRLCKTNLALTGTLSGGKASDLFYLFWRMFPKKMVELGYKYSDVTMFVEHYGRLKKTTKEYFADIKYNKSGKGKKVSSTTEMPGISPLLYTNFLSGTMVSRTLHDMQIPMPKLRFFKHEIEMSEELKAGYDSLRDQFVSFMRQHKGLSLGGSYLHGLLSYLDQPNQEPIYWRDELLVASPKHIEDLSNKLLPKEEKLLETIRRELKEGRRVLVYSVYSGTKGVSDRLMKILSEANFQRAELTSSIKLEKREQWIQDQYEKGTKVIVTNPTNVETGLDIIQYPSIYFYEMGFNVKTIRQAECRSYRPNAPYESRVYYSYYKDSLQEDCMKLVGSKKKASLALEGIFSEDMLSSMGDTGESGAKILYKILEGKIQLRENELDAFGFEDEPIDTVDIVETTTATTSTVIKTVKTSTKEPQQLTLFTVTDDDMERLKKKVKKKSSKVVSGQMSLFAV